MKSVKYLFYRIYQLMISVGNKSTPEIPAFFLMAMTFGLNFFSIISISYLFGYKIDLGLDKKLNVALYCVGLAAVLYLICIHKKKYLEIAKGYELESDKNKLIGKIIAIGYITISFLLLIFSVYLMAMKNRGEL